MAKDVQTANHKMQHWLMGVPAASGEGADPHSSHEPAAEHKQPWWKVMCLTGVDYFSTLGYQPAIAALAAGALAPMATLILVLVTLVGALPVYRKIASVSPHGQGSLALLEKLLPGWKSKLLVLVLLGFAATDFMITITLSAADASAHLIENPITPNFLHNAQVPVTLVLLVLLTLVFLRGFSEAIGLAVALVSTYLALNVVVVITGLIHLVNTPIVTENWLGRVSAATGGSWVTAFAIGALLFPKLALGLSGFETGVAVMPQIGKKKSLNFEDLPARIRGTKKLLTTAALIMSGFLLSSSLVTITLIPADAFADGGPANGRALAYLAHEYLGSAFGSIYDLSTIAILWFAGASAMAALLNLVPRYLPRYGMAPRWANASRPLVLVLAVIEVIITLVFRANVDAQGSAYATGVLVLITSAALAVLLLAWRKRHIPGIVGFGIVTAIFTYTTIANIVERPSGLKIAIIFTVVIIAASFLSRFRRSFELRATDVHLDQKALQFVSQVDQGPLYIVAHEPQRRSTTAYRRKFAHACAASNIPASQDPLFIEVTVDKPSDFERSLHVRGNDRNGYHILQVHGSNVPNTIAAVLLHIRDITGVMPHVFFRWTEGSPVKNMFKYLFFGEGEIAPLTREVLREAEPDVTKRPWVHVS